MSMARLEPIRFNERLLNDGLHGVKNLDGLCQN